MLVAAGRLTQTEAAVHHTQHSDAHPYTSPYTPLKHPAHSDAAPYTRRMHILLRLSCQSAVRQRSIDLQR